MNNLESFKDLAISNSSMRFSSLSGFSNLVNSSLSGSTSFKNISDSVAFKTLADLTAHHLQKNSSLIDNANSNEKNLLPKTNFVIPKLSIKKDNRSDINNVQLDLPTAQKDIDDSILNDRKTDDSMDSLEQSLFSAFAFSRDYPNTIIKSNSQSVKSQNDPVLNVSGTRTPSPDPWIIDLNSTLKETTFLASNSNRHTKSEVLEDIHNVIPISTLQISNENIEIPYAMLPTKLNLSYLRYVKLPYTKKNVSLFGRTLCRTWKLKKPILKSQQEHHKTIRRFDFSVPYTRT